MATWRASTTPGLRLRPADLPRRKAEGFGDDRDELVPYRVRSGGALAGGVG